MITIIYINKTDVDCCVYHLCFFWKVAYLLMCREVSIDFWVGKRYNITAIIMRTWINIMYYR